MNTLGNSSNRVFITGDTHGDFSNIERFCKIAKTTKSDTIIILGDSGLNYFTDSRSKDFKRRAQKLPITLFCIHGNHEERANNIKTYKWHQFWTGKVLVEDSFPSIKFAQDGEVYSIPTMNGKKNAIVIGGAYSVDKQYRLRNGLNWYESEQPDDKIKKRVENKLEQINWNTDLILTHTCPYSYTPREWFLSGIDQSTVDNTTEEWLDKILHNMEHYEKWYCGHYHGEKIIDKLEFMYKTIKQL